MNDVVLAADLDTCPDVSDLRDLGEDELHVLIAAGGSPWVAS